MISPMPVKQLFFFLLFFLTLVACGEVRQANATNNSPLASGLIWNASASAKDKETFFETADDQLARLQRAGILSKNVSSRFDYVSYYKPTRLVTFYGARLMYFENEYLEQFIGCCVDDGFGLILQGSESKEINDFAATNGCKITIGDHVYLPFEINKEFEKQKVKIESLLEISCRFNDTQ
jgi:hypothetical protein